MRIGLKQVFLSLFSVVVLGACASSGQDLPQVKSDQISAEMLLDASPLAEGVELADLSQIDILEFSPEMADFVAGYIKEHHGDAARLQRLLYAVMGEDNFELIYDETTRTAPETFLDRRGNCLSFTNMFVSMARHAGIDAYYQEVEIPPLWSFSGESFLLSKHINVHMKMHSGMTRVVDFNIHDFSTSDDTRVISDNRARAHYFNNIGAEHMLGGDTLLAFNNFRQGILEDGTFSPTWINLGNLYRREGYPEYAAAAYLSGLEADEDSLVAMSNLANLYQEEGQTELAAHYKDLVRAHRMRNPFYRYQLANEAFVNGDYETAIQNIKHAIRLRDNEPRFYSLLSFSYLMSGDRQAAKRWMKKAESVADQQEEKEKYHYKLELLMGKDGAEG